VPCHSQVRFARSYCYIDAGAGPENNRQLFFKSAPLHVTEHDLSTVFSVFGSVEDITLFRDARSGAFRGSGLITMHTRSQAVHVISELDGRHYMLGSLLPLTVKWADPELRAKKNEARRNNDIIHRGLFFARVPYAATEAHVEALFSQFGLVTQVTLIRDYAGAPLSKGFGFATMSRAEEANAAIEALNERHAWHGMPRAMVVTYMNRRLQRQHLRQQNMQRAVAASEAAGMSAASASPARGMASSWTSSCMPHDEDAGSNSSSCSDRPDAPQLHDRVHVASSPSPPPGGDNASALTSEPVVAISPETQAPPEGCEPSAVKLIFKKVPRQCSEDQLKGLLEKVGGSVAEVGFLTDQAQDQAHCTAYVWYTTLAAAEHALANMRLVKALTTTGKQHERRGSDPGFLLRSTRSLPTAL
jgi:RNA recognition motif-containing protein